MKRGLRELGVRMRVTFTAYLRHANKQKHIFSCGNTVTHHYTTCACRCGVAALFFFCPRHCRFGFVAALPLWFCCGIAAVFAALPLGFCCGLAALVLLGQLCSRHIVFCFSRHCRSANKQKQMHCFFRGIAVLVLGYLSLK